MNSNRIMPRANRRIIRRQNRRYNINNNNNNSNVNNINTRRNFRNRFRMRNFNNRRFNLRNNLRNNNNLNRLINNTNNNNNILRRDIQNNLRYVQPKSVNLNIKKNNKDMIVNGKDLILKNDNMMMNHTNGLYAIIPINPTYWENTRIKNIAVLNQFYIPLKISLEFVPVVAKTQRGNISIGCISSSTMTNENMLNVLISSTSGCTFACSNPFTKNIDLNSLITQRKLLVSEKVSPESIPFYIYIVLNGVYDDEENYISPGQFFINYSFKFFNPVTNPIDFKIEQNLLMSQFDTSYANIACILTQENNGYDIGTLLDIEIGEDGLYVFKLNGSKIVVNLDGKALFLYSKQSKENKKDLYSLKDFTKTTSNTNVNFTQFLYVVDPATNTFTYYLSILLEQVSITIPEDRYYFLSQVGEFSHVISFECSITSTSFDLNKSITVVKPSNIEYIDL